MQEPLMNVCLELKNPFGGVGGRKKTKSIPHELSDTEAVEELGKDWEDSVMLLLVFIREKASWLTAMKKGKPQNSDSGNEQWDKLKT